MTPNPFIGLEWADEINDDLISCADSISLIELIPENFFHYNHEQNRFIEKVNSLNTPVLIHSVGLSILSLEPLSKDYLKKIKTTSQRFSNIAGYSDHLSMTKYSEFNIGQLTPTLYNNDILENTISKVKQLQDFFGENYALENLALPFMIPGQEMEEIEFIQKLIEKTDCKIILDLNNLYTNEVNFSINAIEWLHKLPMESVDSIHLAGGFMDTAGIMQDGHCERVPNTVWDLYEHSLKLLKRRVPTIVERTGNNKEGIQPILDDLKIADEIMTKALQSEMELSL